MTTPTADREPEHAPDQEQPDAAEQTDPPPAGEADRPPAGETDPAPEQQPGAEAARYRRRLRDTEAERDTLAERLAGYQRAEVERVAAGTLSRGDDVWLSRLEVAELVDEDGRVDPEKVAAAVAAVLDGRPQLSVKYTRRPKPDPSQRSNRLPRGDAGPAWSDVLRGAAE